MTVQSKKARKKRKDRSTLALHKRGAAMSAHLSKDIKKDVKKRNVPVRKNDVVKVLRGTHRGKTGKIVAVDYRNYKINIENVTLKNRAGKESFIPIDPSNVLITELVLEDEKRKNSIKR
ncbi:MAG: 50S ribosomal protein L24 [DPANN group archaeon]|nr:50S ribosomal protein L24 [DPANN group archaeon]